MKLIPLSIQGKNKGKYFAKVDDADYDCLIQWRWSVAKRGRINYVQRKSGKNYITLMHRQIIGIDTDMVDHINHDGLDNQRHNLRKCTPLQNVRNMRSHKNSYSKHLGVSYTSNKKPRIKKWRAIIKISKYESITKYFHTEEEAAIEYNNMAKKYFGEFANLNII